jgi:P2 family phage contractile tail tube protein
MLPRVLKNFTAYIDGRGYIGRVESCQLPELAVKADEFRGGGMDGPVELEMGINKLDASIVLAEYDPNVIKLWGLFSADTAVVLRGAIQRQGEDAVPVVVRLQGGVKQITRAEWKSGQNSPMTVAVNCNRYSETIGSETLVDIDLLNFVRIVGGVDQLATQRAALGV